jgi:hypothetical protein
MGCRLTDLAQKMIGGDGRERVHGGRKFDGGRSTVCSVGVRSIKSCAVKPESRLVESPLDVQLEPVDSDDFAEFVVAVVADGSRGEREDFAGPETLTMRRLAEHYLATHRLRRRMWNAPLPRCISAALEAGNTASRACRGTTRWADWLRRSAAAAEHASASSLKRGAPFKSGAKSKGAARP